ncbi:MAG: DUF2812 domain-containing protein [Lachnospiraceae bacterium]|nr:DUF2812 domain-containing protein [Lachnospiraceae bacterium]
MIKFKLYFDKDEETKWLNEKADEGWALTGFFAGFYTFEKCEKGKWKYQIDFGQKFGTATEDYREFMADAGIEIVQCWGYWIILRKLASAGDFQLYTDVESSIEHYSKILKLFKVVTIIEIIILFMEIMAAVSGAAIGWVGACIIGALTIALINATVKTKNTILELKSRQSGTEAEKDNRQVSPLLMAGLLLNSCALLMGQSDSLSPVMAGPVRMGLLIIAIIFMLTGAAKTAAMRRNSSK